MAHLTGNFTSEAPLSPAVKEAISNAFDQGWADPKKQSQASGRAAILSESARSEIASALGTTAERLEIVGEPALVHLIALTGFTHGSNPLYVSTIDLGKIRAIARAAGGEDQMIGVDHHGALLTQGLSFSRRSVISLQATNGETGAKQDLDRWRNHSSHVVLDATRTLPSPDLTQGFAATTFDSTAWNGPTGLGIIHIGDEKNFKYPLPHIAPIRVPGSFSLPLLIGSAIALNEFIGRRDHLIELRRKLVTALSTLNGVTLLSAETGSQSRYLSIIVDGFSSEEILRTLLKSDIAVDAGSACSPEDLTPSHVIASMGYPTTGHLRFTLHPEHTEDDINSLVINLERTLKELRS